MGKLELDVKKRSRNSKIQRALLQSLAMAGRMGATSLVARILALIGMTGDISRTHRVRSIKSARKRLVERGWIKKYSDGTLEITEKGERMIEEMEADHMRLPRPQEWDGRWRVLAFDIPERERKLRDKIRYTLASIGFKHLQHSVWVYPFDCEDYIALFKTDLGIGSRLLYIIADGIEDQEHLKKKFNLKR